MKQYLFKKSKVLKLHSFIDGEVSYKSTIPVQYRGEYVYLIFVFSIFDRGDFLSYEDVDNLNFSELKEVYNYKTNEEIK